MDGYCYNNNSSLLVIYLYFLLLLYKTFVGMAMNSTSMSTRFVNGKKVTTKKVVDNGVETVTTYENDVLKSQTVNGVPQAIQVDRKPLGYLLKFLSSIC